MVLVGTAIVSQRNSYNFCDDCRMLNLERNEWRNMQNRCKMKRHKENPRKDEENEDFIFQEGCMVVKINLLSRDIVHGMEIFRIRNVARPCKTTCTTVQQCR